MPLDPTIIDPNAVEALRSLNPGDNDEFLREIIGIFLDDTPQRIAELDQSRAAGDLPRFTRAAHSIKGSSGNLGAVALRAAAEKVENESRISGVNVPAALVEAVKYEYARAEAALTALAKG